MQKCCILSLRHSSLLVRWNDQDWNDLVMKFLNSLLCIFVLVPGNCFTYTLQSDCRHFEISNLLICFTILSPKTMNDFCVLLSLFFLMTFLFSDFGFILSLLFDISVSILLDFYIVKSLLDVSITVVFKSVLLDVSVLCESLCFTGVARPRARVCVCVWSINSFDIISISFKTYKKCKSIKKRF